MRQEPNLVKRFAREHDGLEAVDYAIIACIIVIGAIAALAAIGAWVAAQYQGVQVALGAFQDGGVAGDESGAPRWPLPVSSPADPEPAPSPMADEREETVEDGAAAESGAAAEPPCPWDFDANQLVDQSDLLSLQANWGAPYNVNSLLSLLSAWGSCN